MADPEPPEPDAPKKRSRLPLLIGLAGALLAGGGGFYATWSGMMFATPTEKHATGEEGVPALPAIAFVPVDPMVISLGPAADSAHLSFTAHLEVTNERVGEVTMLMPRILDVLNGYLRAVEVAQLEDPAALVRIRAQMLRRIQIVTGEGRVRDLLITEFVLN